MSVDSLIMPPFMYVLPRSQSEVLLLSDSTTHAGIGFCFNSDGVCASTASFVAGWLVTTLGSFCKAACRHALVYIPGLLVLPFAPDPKGTPSPA